MRTIVFLWECFWQANGFSSTSRLFTIRMQQRRQEIKALLVKWYDYRACREWSGHGLLFDKRHSCRACTMDILGMSSPSSTRTQSPPSEAERAAMRTNCRARIRALGWVCLSLVGRMRPQGSWWEGRLAMGGHYRFGVGFPCACRLAPARSVASVRSRRTPPTSVDDTLPCQLAEMVQRNCRYTSTYHSTVA